MYFSLSLFYFAVFLSVFFSLSIPISNSVIAAAVLTYQIAVSTFTLLDVANYALSMEPVLKTVSQESPTPS